MPAYWYRRPPNRHRRRAEAARLRPRVRPGTARARAERAAPRLAARLAQGGAGLVLLAVGAFLLATPQGFQTARGPAFVLLAGLILLGLALRPR
jgi:hypothetical protein